MMRLFTLILGVLLMAGPALSTPPRVTMSEDRLMAATQSHIYVLRDVIDNKGSHYATLHDQHLVEISLDTGAATRFWPLRHMAIDDLVTDDYLSPGQVTERAGEVHDMIEILRRAGAEPLSPGPWAVEVLALRKGALMRGQTDQLLTPFGIRAAGRAQLGILRDYYPPIETEEEYRQAARIDFYDLYADGDWDCTLQPEGQTLFRPKERILLAKLRCEDFDLSGTWSFHVLIREEQ